MTLQSITCRQTNAQNPLQSASRRRRPVCCMPMTEVNADKVGAPTGAVPSTQ